MLYRVLLVVGASQAVSKWDSFKSELLCQVVHQEPQIVLLEYGLVVYEKDEMGWAHLGLYGVVYLKSSLCIFGQVVQLLELVDPVIQQPSAYALVPLVVS